MKLNKSLLKKVIRESIEESMSDKDKLKTNFLSTFNRSIIMQAYELCYSIPELDFKQIVREMIDDLTDSVSFQNQLHDYVNNLSTILHSGKQEFFYIEDENLETDIHMDFVFKTIADITQNIVDYYVNMFVAIGEGK